VRQDETFELKHERAQELLSEWHSALKRGGDADFVSWLKTNHPTELVAIRMFDQASLKLQEEMTRAREDRLYALYGQRSNAANRIIAPPGHTLISIARFVLTASSYKKYVQPVIADMHHEYFAALAQGDMWHARWISARVWLQVLPGFIYAMIARAVFGLFSARS
jgi:hypothetical protein